MRPEILDTTLREGEQTPGVVFSKEQKLEIATLLDEFGVDIIEVGHPMAAILSSAMMLDFLGENKKAGLIRNSITDVLRQKNYTRDMGGKLGTREFTKKVIDTIS